MSESTQRLILETLTPSNMSPDYVEWLEDPEIVRYVEVRHAKHTGDTVARFVESMLASANDLMMGIFIKTTGRHIGNIKLGGVNWHYGRGDIGVIIGDKACWGQGYGTEAIDCLSRLAFAGVGLRRLEAGAYASNKGCIKAFLKAGFREEGVLADYWLLNGKPEDSVLMGRLAQRDRMHA